MSQGSGFYVSHQLKKNFLINSLSLSGKFHFFHIYKARLQGDNRFAIAILYLTLLN
ncbi:hypothetical protein [Coleofasciculus sp. FACHB-SPT9]|uniref:hypothetical protein n=1 Tax=Cyanophyceae TaxID=3028117 RepID=UPI0016840FA4|nr:hypothetical protein [Coleofasciculus sp. FACHB-SPT9]